MGTGRFKMDTWFGVASKVGTQLLIGGVESMTGTFINLDKPDMRRKYEMTSSRWGLGLGWDAGVVVTFVFNSNELYWLNGQRIHDWGVNIALGANVGPILKALKDSEFGMVVGLIKRLGMGMVWPHIDTLRNIGSFVANAVTSDDTVLHPVVSFEVPGLGGGEELAAFKTSGTMYVDHY
jgi:hypothetical protein